MIRAAVLALLLAGCATIDTDRAPPADWPTLRVEVAHVSREEVSRGVGVPSLGSAQAFFTEGVCRILLAVPDAWVLEHEELHCAGYDHPGGKHMRNAWQEYKNGKR